MPRFLKLASIYDAPLLAPIASLMTLTIFPYFELANQTILKLGFCDAVSAMLVAKNMASEPNSLVETLGKHSVATPV